MKGWILVCLLVHFTALNTLMGQDDCTAGEIMVIGIDRENVTAGRIEVCISGEWRAVCAGGWGLRDARVVCRQLRSSKLLGYQSEVCKGSCFGSSEGTKGVTNYNCTGSESRLMECPHSARDNPCDAEAGIVCYRQIEFIIEECTLPPTQSDSDTADTEGRRVEEQTTCPTPTQSDCTCANTEFNITDCPPTRTEEGRGEEQKTETVTCTALGGGLGAPATILALTLIGVVLGWVWYCHIRKEKQTNLEGEHSSVMFQNRTYTSTFASTPVQYGTEDTAITQSPPVHTAENSPPGPTYAVVNKKTKKENPQNNTQPWEQNAGEGRRLERNHSLLAEGEYDEVGGGGGDGDYHVLEGPGAAYEVPVPTKTAYDGVLHTST